MGGGMGMGLGGLLVLGILSLVFGKDFVSMAGGGGGATGAMPSQDASPYVGTPEEEEMIELVSFVLDDAQSTWSRLFAERGQQYREARLVLFKDMTTTACGYGQAASGPFYCPPDERVFIDLGFFNELHQRFAAPGDFAQAYVIAHEIGHHVQHVIGIDEQVRAAQQQNPDDANEWSVRLELQADCFAGVWGHSAAQRNHLDPEDTNEGLTAAAAIGDDRIQRMSGGTVSPEGFTHGSSAQRVEWFRRGLDSGQIESCNTYE
jgi:predicted metalloprotease